MDLYDALTAYAASDACPFHMPGHKRRLGSMRDPFTFDITEIDGFDDLHHPEGILKEAQERAAALWHSSETHFLVNGSTAGILTAVHACARPGAALVMARGCHRSAYNAAALSRQDTRYLRSEDRGVLNGPVDPEELERVLDECGDVSAVLLTSPTYDGIVSDIARAAQAVHSRGIPLIVDEAHGAHFGMHPVFPASSVELGADLVIHSLHKTLPSLTQTALLHVNGDLVDRPKVRRMLSVFQTSSPSYVLMASIDRCVRLLQESGNDLFDRYASLLTGFRAQADIPGIRLLETDDPSRILLQPEIMSARELYDTLRERFLLQPEMCTPSYVLMLSSVADDEAAFRRLLDALRQIGETSGTAAAGAVCRTGCLPAGRTAGRTVCRPAFRTISRPETFPPQRMPLYAALDAPQERIPLREASGRICAEYLYLYPPGIPLLAPGEEITLSLLERIRQIREAGLSLQGPADYTLETIWTVKEAGGFTS